MHAWRSSVCAIAGVVALGIGSAADAQGSRPPVPASGEKGVLVKARLIGVFDEQSGTPIDGAEVVDIRSGTFVLTTSTGTAALSFLPEGVSMVRVRKVGFAPQTLLVVVSLSDTLPITVVLERVTELPTMLTRDSAPTYVSPRLNAFEERRKRGGGSFISEADLRKNDSRQLGEVLLSRIPGITVRELRLARWGKGTVLVKENGTGGGVLVGGSARCYPDIYLDDVKIPGFAPGIGADLSQISVNTLAGVEYHDISNLPIQWSGSASGCGAVLLWSRER